jgi:hypothetical protein
MRLIGKPNDTVRPEGFLEGPGGVIPISGLTCVNSVGSIPICRVFIPPEFLSQIPDEQTDDLYKVKIKDGEEDVVIFTGYVAGDNGKITGTRVMGGVDLVHPARDLDESRISAPSLHPASIVDYSYTLLPEGDFGGSGFSFEPATFFTSGGGKLPEQIVNGLKKEMESLQSESSSNGGETVKTETLQRGIDLLGRLKFKDGTLKESIEGPLASGDSNNSSINTWVRQRCEGSFNAARSVWDTLTSIFSEFGIYLIGDGDGGVFTAADCAGMFVNPFDNLLDGKYVATFDKVSAITRSIAEVQLASENVRANMFDDSGGPGGFVSFMDGKQGATLVLQMPGWLNPIVETESEGLVKAQQDYAKAMLYLERSKFRTISASGPLAPRALPGTIVQVAPYSAMKARSGGQIEDFNKTYFGYCYQVAHEIDVSGQIFQTTFFLKNVTSSGDSISEHPLFSDVTPFSLE